MPIEFGWSWSLLNGMSPLSINFANNSSPGLEMYLGFSGLAPLLLYQVKTDTLLKLKKLSGLWFRQPVPLCLLWSLDLKFHMAPGSYVKHSMWAFLPQPSTYPTRFKGWSDGRMIFVAVSALVNAIAGWGKIGIRLGSESCKLFLTVYPKHSQHW